MGGYVYCIENWRHAGFLYIGIRKRENNVQMNFLGCGAFLCLYSVILAFNLKSEPEKGLVARAWLSKRLETELLKGDLRLKKMAGWNQPDGTGENDGEKRTFWNELFACTLFEPTFYCAALVQASTTPIAEFQSQLPIWLSMDKTLSPTHVSFGVSAWHAGILCSVSMFGIMFDHIQSNARKGILLAFPMFCNFACFISIE